MFQPGKYNFSVLVCLVSLSFVSLLHTYFLQIRQQELLSEIRNSLTENMAATGASSLVKQLTTVVPQHDTTLTGGLRLCAQLKTK